MGKIDILDSINKNFCGKKIKIGKRGKQKNTIYCRREEIEGEIYPRYKGNNHHKEKPRSPYLWSPKPHE